MEWSLDDIILTANWIHHCYIDVISIINSMRRRKMKSESEIACHAIYNTYTSLSCRFTYSPDSILVNWSPYADIKSRISRQHHSYRKFCVDFRNHCLQAEILSPHSQINQFQNGRQEVIVTKYNLNKHDERPKIPFKPSNITNLWMHKSLLALLLLYCSCKLSKFKIADKMAAKWSFHHNLCISSADLIIILGESYSSC